MVASVHRGTAARGACMSSWHSIQEVSVGNTTRAWPLKPSVPPSMSGLSDSAFAMSTIPTSVALIHLRASILSSPQIMILNCM